MKTVFGLLTFVFLSGCSSSGACYFYGCYKPVKPPNTTAHGPTCETPIPHTQCTSEEMHVCKPNVVGCNVCKCKKIKMKVNPPDSKQF